MKVDPTLFAKILKSLMIVKASKALIEPLQIEFTESQAVVRQFDPSMTIAVISFMTKDMFGDYKAYGKVQLPVSLVKILSKAFADASEVDIDFTEDSIVIRTSTAEYVEKMPAVEVKEVDINKIRPTQHGILFREANIAAVYEFDIAYLYKLLQTFKYEAVAFEYSDVLRVVFEGEIAKFSKQIPANPTVLEEPGRACFFTDPLKYIAKNISGLVTFTFTREGPLAITARDPVFVTYLIAPKIEE